MKSKLDLAKFNPRRLAHFEKENYVAYYRRRWLRLLVVSISMVKEAYQLSLPQALYGAYLVARAEMAAAPFPDNDIPTAEAYMRRFFELIKRIYALQIDVDQTAQREVNWWVVHRRLFAQEEHQELIEALAKAMSVFFHQPEENLLEAARLRALGMYYSDRWVRSDMPAQSELLILEENALCAGYSSLRDALLTGGR